MAIDEKDLESSVSQDITANVNRHANTTNQAVADSYMSNAGRGLLNHSNNQFNDSLSYGNAATTQAIRNRYMPQFERQEKQLKLDNIQYAAQDRLRNLQVATQAAGEEVALNKQKAILKDKIEKANRAARGQVVGTVLGIVGGVVAGIFTGGTGAVAGYAAGNAAGNAIGSS